MRLNLNTKNLRMYLMRNSICTLIVLWLLFCVNVGAAPPTDIKIKLAYADNPTLIYEMVRKLYVLEHAIPTIDIPELSVIETEERTIVEYRGDMSIYIGDENHNLDYTIKIEPQEVVIGKVIIPETPWGLIIGVGVGTTLLSWIIGFVVGFAVH